ncbi:MAG: rod shape-determining protein MreC [Endomicrobium sp.]|nr:rod shape-determining protein MreC [Endomicrobium sp.]
MYRHQKSKYGNIIFVVLLLLGFSFIIFRFTYPLKLVKTLIYYSVYPNINTADYIFCSVGDFADNIKSTIYVRQENIAYKQKNQELTDKLRNYDAIFKEYDDLSKFLKFNKIKNTVSVFARISVREPNEWYQWFIIDKGEKDGLYNELPVVMFNKKNGTLCSVGKIVETYKTSSKVVMITNSIYTLPVEIKNKDIICLAEGFNSDLLRIKYIPYGADVKPGDEIVVSALSAVFQKGIPVGIVVNVSEDESTDFKTATAEVFFEKDTICQAIILIPQAE